MKVEHEAKKEHKNVTRPEKTSHWIVKAKRCKS